MTDDTDLGMAFLMGFSMGLNADGDEPEDAPTPAPCDDCTCSLADDDLETRTIEVDLEFGFAEDVEAYVRERGDVRESEAIDRVEVCPQKIVAHLSQDAFQA